MFAAGSCQKEIEFLEGDTQVSFEISTGEIATKAIADATNITVLHWELYGADFETAAAPFGEGKVEDTDGNKSFKLDLRLVADQDYKIVFWAETEHGATHYDTQDLRSVKIKTYADENANDESRAAFFGSYAFHTENGVKVEQQVVLKRPFAQINLGTTNYETSLNQVNGGKLVVESTEMTVNAIANSFNTLEGVGESDFDGVVTFKAAPTPNGAADQNEKKLIVNNKDFYWIGMNYLIVTGDSDLINVDVVLNTNMGVVEHTIENVPVKENYRTNILGDFLTVGAEFEIVVDEKFGGDVILPMVTNSDELAQAVAAAKDGDTIYISDEVTMPYFTGKTLNFIGITDHAAVRQSPADHLSTSYDGAGLNFYKLTLIGTSYTSSTQGYQKAVKETYKECHFVDYIMFAGEETIVTDCTFENKDQYFWTGTAKDITFENCVFNGTERAVKVCTVGNHAERTATFNNCKFTAATQVKSALEIDGSKGSTYTVYVNGCTATGFATSDFTGESLFNIEGAENVTVYVDGNKWAGKGLYEDSDGNPVVTSIEGLQLALDNAAEGTNTIKIAKNLAGEVYIHQKAGVHIVLEGQDYEYDGTIKIHNGSRYNDATLLIKNIAFKTSTEALNFIMPNEFGVENGVTRRYSNNVTVQDCSFTATGAAENTAVGVQAKSCNNLQVIGCTATGVHSLVQAQSCGTDVIVKNSTVAGKNGVAFKQVKNAVVEGTTINAAAYGIRFDGNIDNYGVTVKDCNVTAVQPVIVRKMTGANNTIALEGTNTFTTEAAYQVVITNGSDDAEYVVPTGTYTLTGAEGLSVFPVVDTKKLYKVTTPEELLKYAYMVQNVDHTLQVEIMNDITLPQYEIAADDAKQTYVYTTTPITVSAAGVPSGNNWMPLGTASVMFEGTIEGHENTIKGLRIKSDDQLLGFVAAAMTPGTYIKNLNFEDAVVSGTSLVGTVAGYVRDGVQITNCHVRNVSVNGTSDNVGALVGQHYTRYKGIEGIEGGKLPKTVMENCTADAASTVKGRNNVGGIAGLNYGGVMINCRNAATVEGESCVGGVAGYTRDYHHYKSGYIIACGNEGKVSGTSSVGSITGHSLKDNNHQPSVSAVVACWSTAEEGSYPYLLVSTCINAVNYGSWGIKTQSSQSVSKDGKNTACYAFNSAADITKAQVDAMNTAIDAFNAVADFECPYKWSWTAGSLPVLTK